MNLNGIKPLVICYNNCLSFLARSLAPWRYDSSNMAHNGKNSEISPKLPALVIPYLHGHGGDPSSQRCYECMGLRFQYMPLANPHSRLLPFSPLEGK